MTVERSPVQYGPGPCKMAMEGFCMSAYAGALACDGSRDERERCPFWARGRR